MAAIRALVHERDQDTDERALHDIVECQAPNLVPGPASFTAVSRDVVRRQMLLELSRQVDRLLSGEADEITLVLID